MVGLKFCFHIYEREFNIQLKKFNIKNVLHESNVDLILVFVQLSVSIIIKIFLQVEELHDNYVLQQQLREGKFFFHFHLILFMGL